MAGRVVRIFLSSTFRDFGEERDLLVRKVFPSLRAKLQSRFVDLVDVDLRWGITEEEAERGEVLPICLSEIDRARPYFIGFLGERYGWVPPPNAYPSHVLESQAWLEEHRGGKSVTELEILHGVLNNPHMEGRALFYFRSLEYSSSKGGDYIASSPDDEARQSTLKETIRHSGFPVYEDYTAPEHLAELLEKDLWEILDREFPASDIPDAFVRENLQHEAYELPRQRLYIGGDKYLTALDTALSQGKQWILVDGPSGGGKSALLANWLQSVRDHNKNIEVHAHYLGATADATDPVFLVRRLIECIKRKTESTEDLASDPDELLDSLPTWLANASSWCELRGKKFLFVIDALNGLTDRRNLRWFPRMLPKHIHLVISTLPGEVNDALQEKANWSHVSVMPLEVRTAELIFKSYLAMFNKTLPNELVAQVMAHKLAVNPLFLLTLAEELRLFGEHEQLSNRLDHYLTSITVDDLFERVLERIEQDYGADTLREIMTALWAARSGLREEEILGYSGLKPMHWAYIRNALGPTLIDASGRLIFAHDYMRIAVSDRYMAGNNTIGNEGQSEEALNLRHAAHKKLVRWFEEYAFQDGQGIVSDERAAEEIPYQWQQAQDWKKLQTSLTQQKMLNAILDHRTEQELLSYWLKLEANIKTDIETQYEKAWKKWKLNEHEEATGDIAEELSDFLAYGGRYRALAKRLRYFTVENRKQIFGERHKKTNLAIDNLANLLRLIGEFDEAELYFRRAINIAEQILEGDDLELSRRYAGLGVLFLECKKNYDEAEKYLQLALSITQDNKASDEHDLAIDYNNLALLYDRTGKNKEALKAYRHSLILRQKKLGSNHPATATAKNNLGLFLSNAGKLQAAEPLLRTALQIREKMLGPEHPRTSVSLNNLAILLDRTGEDAEAKLLYERSLDVRKAVWGEQHHSTAKAYRNLARFLFQNKDYENAISHLNKALEIQVNIFGFKHEETLSSAKSLALTFYKLAEQNDEQENYIEAANWYERTLELEKTYLGPDHEDLIITHYKLGQVLANQSKYLTAEEHYRNALKIEVSNLGADHADIAITYYNLGKTLTKQAKYLDAEDYFQKTLKIELRELGDDDPDIALTLLWLGESQFHQAKFADAEQNLQKALSLQIAQYSEHDIELKHVLELLRDVSVALGKDTDAQNFAEKIKSLEKS
ncbi:tetratricopeptide repeat protein [Paracoccaceae bacterium]|nr:tetratricopeptide repeat protein [Paracoccaceae bacterium]